MSSQVYFLQRRVPEDCPQDVANLWQACLAENPSVRPSAANVQSALKRLQSVPRPVPTPPLAQAAPDPPTAGTNTRQGAERFAGAPSSGGVQAGNVPEPAAGSAISGEPVDGQPIGAGSHEDQAAAKGAAANSAPEPELGELGAAGGVTTYGEAKRPGANSASSDSHASPLDVPRSL